jgi:hypothetical protein
MEFNERQYFRKWWFLLILVLVMGGAIYGMVQQVIFDQPFGNNPMSNSGFIVLMLLLVFLFGSILMMRLETKIDDKGIRFGFYPFQSKGKFYAWNEIADISVVKYNPLIDYGGWGWRISLTGQGQAYNVSGNKGIVVVLKNGKKRLVGTQRPEEARIIIDYHFNHPEAATPKP